MKQHIKRRQSGLEKCQAGFNFGPKNKSKTRCEQTDKEYMRDF